VETAEKLTG